MAAYIPNMTYDEEIQVEKVNVDAYEQLKLSMHTFETAFWFKEFHSVKEVVHALCTVETPLFCAMLKRNESFFEYACLQRTYALIYAALLFPIKSLHIRETDVIFSPLHNNRVALLNACNARIPPFIFYLEWDKLTWEYNEIYSVYAKDFYPSIDSMKTLNFDDIRWTPLDDYTKPELDFLESQKICSPKSSNVSLDEFEDTLNEELLMHFIHTLDKSQVEQLLREDKISPGSRMARFTHNTLKQFAYSTRDFGGRMHLRAQMLYEKLKDVNESTAATQRIQADLEHDCDFWDEDSNFASESESESELDLQLEMEKGCADSDDEGDACIVVEEADVDILSASGSAKPPLSILADLYLVHAFQHI